MAAILEPAELQALLLSLRVALCATLAGLVPAAALALWLARTRSRLRVVVEALVVLPLVLPPVVVGYFLLVAFGRNGWLGGVLHSVGIRLPFTWLGAALAALLLGLPLMVRAMRQAFENVDPALEEAAATLGAGRLRVFFSVTRPLAMRGCIAGLVLCFARSLGEFGATITFAGNVEGQTRTLPLAIWTALQSARTEPQAWRLTWVCVVLSLCAALSSEVLVRRSLRAEGLR